MKFYIQRCVIPKPILMRINLTCLLLLISLLQVSASGFAQKISLSKKSISLQHFFKEIKAQSGYDFLYEPQDLKNIRPIDVNLSGIDIKEALNRTFSSLPLTFSIDQNTIVIRKKEVLLFGPVRSFLNLVNIRGRVLDEKGSPLPGATIKLKNGTKTVITNAQGEFQMNNIEENALLQVSFLGYKMKELKADPSGDMTIRLEVNPAELEVVTVVSTGYQNLPKERATGAFNVISKEQLDKPSTNIAQRLIGTTAGMQATMDEDGNPRFEIRGQTSLNIRDNQGKLTQNAYPLVVVDGFAIQGDFSTINPNDIESITILKDAAAASIWGARSANGVIVIVTKKGKKGIPLRINFSAFTRVASKLDLDYVNPLASSSKTVDYEVKAFGNWSSVTNPGSLNNYDVTWSPVGTALNEHLLGFISTAEKDALLDKYRNLSNKKQIADELLSNPFTQQYNLNLSGASEKMSNSLSLLYEKSKTNFKGTDNSKYMFNYRANADVFKWLEFSFSGMVNYNKANRNGIRLADIQEISPYEMLKNEDGSLNNISQYYTPVLQRFVPTNLFPYSDWSYNPIQEISNRKFSNEQLNTRLQAGLKFKIIKGLSVDTKIQYELSNTTVKEFSNEKTFKVRDSVNRAATWDQATNKITLNLPKGGMFNQRRLKTETYNFRNQLNYDRRFGEKHELNIVGGSEINSIVTQSFGNPTTYGFNDQTLSVGTFPNGPGGTTFPIKDWLGTNQIFNYTNSYGHVTERYFSLFGNAAYTYDNKYTLSGSIRTDASNLITDDPSYRYAPFWSVGLGWQLNKENFIKDLSWVNRLNLRATYGYNGNVDRSTSFRPLINMAAIPNPYTGNPTATISSFGNPSLRWEKTGTWNLGIDYSLFQGHLYGKVDVYNKSGKDLIASISIPAVNGTTTQKLNNAEIYNRGIEIELGSMQKIYGDAVVWRGNLNFSYNKNKITRLFVANYAASTLVSGGSAAYVAEQDANSLWRFQYAGIENKQPMVYGLNGAKYDFGAFTPGDGRGYLLNMGTSVAPYTFGFVNSFQVYDFNLSFIITGKFGHKFQRMGFNYPDTRYDRVLPNNKIDEVQNGDPMKIVPLPLNQIEPRYYFWDRFHQSLSYLIEDASHLRMQEVNLSYNFPAAVLSKFKMSRLQVFAQGNDLFTLVANNAGEDPEYPMGTLKPQPRVSLGLKCEF
ncbi:SusC/RagA family TonB-linked outer membrane protein [Pedobacter sp. KBW06]|nr:SusC/RagA family TonB-linked outer membrane protein [Pedobacter sp. KBW06]